MEALADAACLLDGGLRVAASNRVWRRLTGEVAAGAQLSDLLTSWAGAASPREVVAEAQQMGRASGQATVVGGRGAAAEDGLAPGAVQTLYVARVDASCLLAILRPAAEGPAGWRRGEIAVCDAGGRLIWHNGPFPRLFGALAPLAGRSLGSLVQAGDGAGLAGRCARLGRGRGRRWR